MKSLSSISIIILVLFVSCQKQNAEPPYNETELAPLSIEFDNIVGGRNLYLNTQTYFNTSGEEYSVTMLQYFISNISLAKEDGTVYVVPQDSSYFLIKEGDAALAKANVRVPAGDYSTLSFVIGVDSLRNTMDLSKRTGVLDPAGGMNDGMYWGWNSGYIFLKMEGLSAAAPLDPSGQRKFRYHIGGFGGYSAPTINNIKTVKIDLRTAGVAMVRKGRRCNIHLMVDIAKIMDGIHQLRIADDPTIMFSERSTLVADNYATMFSHDHTEHQ